MKRFALQILAVATILITSAASLAGQGIVSVPAQPVSFMEFAVACDGKSSEQVRDFFLKKGWNHSGSQWETIEHFGWERFESRNASGETDSATVYIFDKKSVKGFYKTTERSIFKAWERAVTNYNFQTESLLIEKDMVISKFHNDDYIVSFYEREKSFRSTGRDRFIIVVEKRGQLKDF
ncbi:MAG: hypothetical protein CVT97_00490 [Bacteroidetes bacterium HGW-Bacteroidetes-14]|jgi:hypothetical protein|nr:MAG: hypothetical protein CVT97_00490 [Bacteroidetes bacterium HGW-Bacteroidetes-14]